MLLVTGAVPVEVAAAPAAALAISWTPTSSVSVDTSLFLDRAGNEGRPLAFGRNSGGPIGWDDELRFTTTEAGTDLVIVSDPRLSGSGAYVVTVADA